MANPKLATTDYVDGEVAKKQDYFADVAADEVSGNRELSLKDANSNVVGKIIAQKEGGTLFKDVATPTKATDGANKGYADNNFANALKGTASGVSVRLDDVSPIEHTLGVKVSSKNLIPYPYAGTSKIISGVTFTVNSDGSVTTNGTATANIVFELESDATMFTLPAGNYFLSGCPSGGSSTSYFMAAANGTGISYDKFLRDFGNGISVPSKGEKWKVTIRIMSGYTADNLVFKPQIELGSTATAYTPYISDLTTATVTRCGKNLFDKSTLTAGSNISDLTQTTNGFTFKTTATSKTMNVGSNIYLPAGTYYCSGTVTCSDTSYKGGWAVYDNENKAFIINDAYKGTINNKFTITESKTYQLNFYAPYNAPIGVTMTFENIQLELGTTATEYEPYKMPTEYTPAADGTVSGVKSLYPTTTLMTDTEGAIIEAEYNRDINKAFAELQQAIISLGGNV